MVPADPRTLVRSLVKGAAAIALVLAPVISAAQDAGPHRGGPRGIAPRPGLQLRKRQFTGVYRLFDDRDGVASGAVFEQIDAVVARGGFRIRGDAGNIVLRDITLKLAQPTNAPELPEGIEIQGTVHDVLIERVVARDFQMVPRPERYTNGDGFATERGATRILFRKSKSFDNADGGFDLKSSATRLEDTEAAGNGVNYRLWGTGTATTITSRDPRKAHLQINATADWTIDTLIASAKTPAPVLMLHGDGTIRIRRCILDVPPGTRIVKIEDQFHPHVELGIGCHSA